MSVCNRVKAARINRSCHNFTFPFVKDVLKEVTELFPGPYIHIGGDEVPKDRWKECNACQKAIREHGLKNTKLHTAEERLQRTFNEEIAVYLHGLGKRMIGWDEVLADDLNREVIVMSWRGLGRATAAIRKGHDVIVSADSHLYLNHYQTINSEQEPRATGGLVEMKKVFETPFFSPQLTETERKPVCGVHSLIMTQSWIICFYPVWLLSQMQSGVRGDVALTIISCSVCPRCFVAMSS